MKEENKKYIIIHNHESIKTELVPVLDYDRFCAEIVELMQQNENHCVPTERELTRDSEWS